MSDQARAIAAAQSEQDSLNRVRRRVTVIGFLAIALHALVAFPLLAQWLGEDDRIPEAVMMLVLSALAGVLVVVVSRLILGRPPINVLWAVIGLLPAAAGVYLVWWAPFTLFH